MRNHILHTAEELLPTLDEIAAAASLTTRQLRAYYTTPFAIYRDLTQAPPFTVDAATNTSRRAMAPVLLPSARG